MEGATAPELLNPEAAINRSEVVSRMSAFGGEAGSRLFTAAKREFDSPDSKRVAAGVSAGGDATKNAGHT